MNEQNPEATPVDPTLSPAFKDCHIGLVIFGILTILMGCLCGLLVLLMLAGLAIAAKNPNVPPTPFSSLLPAVFMYVALVAGLIWLGISSILARRWARALLLIFSWAWFVIGICAAIFLALFMPKILAHSAASGANGQLAMPAAAITGVMIGMLLFLGFFFILLPAIWIFFYGSRHVKATCETRDPVTRWTDACPLPVLGLCLWLLFGVPMLLLMPVIAHGVVPFLACSWMACPARWCACRPPPFGPGARGDYISWMCAAGGSP